MSRFAQRPRAPLAQRPLPSGAPNPLQRVRTHLADQFDAYAFMLCLALLGATAVWLA